jgi:hypothetical protein
VAGVQPSRRVALRRLERRQLPQLERQRLAPVVGQQLGLVVEQPLAAREEGEALAVAQQVEQPELSAPMAGVLKSAIAKRTSGDRPSALQAMLAAGAAGIVVAVLVYRVLRS